MTFSADIADALFGYRAALWAAFLLTGLSLIATIIYSIMDKPAEKYFNRVVDPSENELNFKAVLHFDPRFFLISLLCMVYYSGVLPFVAILSKSFTDFAHCFRVCTVVTNTHFCSDYLVKVYHYSSTSASWISGIVTLASMLLSPVLGKSLDFIGYRPHAGID